MLENDKNEKRIQRHKDSQEDFTPQAVIDEIFTLADEELFTDFTKTYLDTSAGTGNLLCAVLKRRLQHSENDAQAINALSTLYGCELYQDNVDECHTKMKNILEEKYPGINIKFKPQINYILENNIIQADFTLQDPEFLFS